MMMGVLFKRYKMKFRHALKPLLAMLVARQKALDRDEWINLVNRTRNAVKKNPLEFLGPEMPDMPLVNDVLDDIFHEFMKERAFHASAAEKITFMKIFRRN